MQIQIGRDSSIIGTMLELTTSWCILKKMCAYRMARPVYNQLRSSSQRCAGTKYRKEIAQTISGVDHPSAWNRHPSRQIKEDRPTVNKNGHREKVNVGVCNLGSSTEMNSCKEDSPICQRLFNAHTCLCVRLSARALFVNDMKSFDL
jgi:hypothetical protein